MQQQQQARQQAAQRAQQYMGMQAHACQFLPVPAGGIDSELSSLSGGMAGRQAGIGAVGVGACGTQSAVPVHGCLGPGMAGQNVLVQMQQLISMMSPQQAQAAQTDFAGTIVLSVFTFTGVHKLGRNLIVLAGICPVRRSRDITQESLDRGRGLCESVVSELSAPASGFRPAKLKVCLRARGVGGWGGRWLRV